jgi:hypothetical protein
MEVLEDRTVPSTYTVTNTGDNGGVNPATGAGTGTLRQAIVDANAAHTGTAANPDLIQFNLSASDPNHFYYRNDGVAGHVSLANVTATTAANDSTISDIDPDWAHSWWSIQPATDLPTISDIAMIDGYTQAGASPNTLSIGDNAVLKIQLNQQASSAGLGIYANNTTIRGLVLDDPSATGTGIYVTAANDQVVGNLIGTDPSGTQGIGHSVGVRFDNASNLLIGGTTAAARNIISGNGLGIYGTGTMTGVQIEGNYIGTDLTGTMAIGNTSVGIHTGATIGGTAPGAGNLISGNYVGIYGGIIQGNLIGTDATGKHAVGNFIGISAADDVIGGLTPAARNIISGNTRGIDRVGVPIEGNYIGTDITGMMAVGNGDGIWTGSGSIVGGTTAGAGNVISGNSSIGIRVFGNGGQIEGNLIGTDYTGTSALSNNFGIYVDGVNNNVIGGTVPGAGNTIAFTDPSGVNETSL